MSELQLPLLPPTNFAVEGGGMRRAHVTTELEAMQVLVNFLLNSPLLSTTFSFYAVFAQN
jgi:hypothetical protein